MTRQVRLLVSAAGDTFAGQPGDVVTMPDELADAWADGVRGELVATSSPGAGDRSARKAAPKRQAKRSAR